MKLLPVISVLLLSVALCVSCGSDRRIDAVLSAADSLVFAAPDSAVALLESLDVSRGSDDQIDRHALLLAKAREKAYVTVSDAAPDSLLSRSIASLDRAVRHFRGRGDSLEVQMLFYRGVLLGYRGDYSDALVSLMEAADRAADTDDHFYRAMAYSEQAEVYDWLYSYAERAEKTELSAKYFLSAGRPLYALRERMMLAQSLIRINDMQRGFDVLNEIKADTLLTNRHFIALYHRIMSEAYFRSGDYGRSLLHSDSINIYAGQLSSIEYSSASRSASALKQFDKAEDYLGKAKLSAKTKNDTANYLYSLAELYSSEGKYDKFYDVFMKYYTGEVDLNNKLLTHPYTTLLYKHFEDQSELNRNDYLITRNILWFLGIISFLLVLTIICIIVLFRNRMQLKNERAETLVTDLTRFKQQVDDLQVRLKNESHNHNKDIYHHPYTPLINRLCDYAATIPENEKGLLLLGKNVSNEIHNLPLDEIYSELEKYINASNKNLMTRFKEQFSGLSDKKYFATLLIFAGFSNQFIRLALKYDSLSSARSIRNRLKQDILNSSAPDRDEFLAHF